MLDAGRVGPRWDPGRVSQISAQSYHAKFMPRSTCVEFIYAIIIQYI